MITRNKIISIVLLFALLLLGCTKQNAVEPIQAERTSGLTQISVMTETVLPKPTSTKPERGGDESVLYEFKNYEESFNQAIRTTQWIQQISTQNIFMERTQTYTNWGIFEEWYRFDADGNFVEGYNWLSSSDGTIEQESCLYNGRFYNVTLGSSGKSDVRTTHIDFTGGFAERFQNGNNLQHEQVEYQGVDAEKFSYEMKDGVFEFVHVIYFDATTHYVLGKETWRKESDGSMKLDSDMIITSFIVNADPPLEHFKQIMKQVPK